MTWDPPEMREARARLADAAAALIRQGPGNEVVTSAMLELAKQGHDLSEALFREVVTRARLNADHEVGRVHAVVDGDYATISTLIDEERYEPASTQLDALAARVGERDPEVVRLRTMLHFLSTS